VINKDANSNISYISLGDLTFDLAFR